MASVSDASGRDGNGTNVRLGPRPARLSIQAIETPPAPHSALDNGVSMARLPRLAVTSLGLVAVFGFGFGIGIG
jgi:hypothetical protein